MGFGARRLGEKLCGDFVNRTGCGHGVGFRKAILHAVVDDFCIVGKEGGAIFCGEGGELFIESG